MFRLDPVDSIPAIVMAYAGPGKGPFQSFQEAENGDGEGHCSDTDEEDKAGIFLSDVPPEVRAVIEPELGDATIDDIQFEEERGEGRDQHLRRWGHLEPQVAGLPHTNGGIGLRMERCRCAMR